MYQLMQLCQYWMKGRIHGRIKYILGPGFLLIGFMVLNATFNNISVISWRSVLLVEETGGSGENHRPVASQTHFIT